MRSTTTSLSTTRGLALLGGMIAAVLFLAVGVAVGAVPRLADTAGDGAAEAAPPAGPAEPAPAAAPADLALAAAAESPVDAAVESPTPAPTAEPETARTAPTTTAAPEPEADVAAAPSPEPAPPVPPKLPPGQRVNPTSAQVQAAIAELHGRIPLFQPNDPQLRTFADAVCTSFDQGQSFAQVTSTVQQAVSNVQGASLSAADADFAVRTVLQLRCPGWLP